MSTRQSDPGFVTHLQDIEARVRKLERGENFSTEMSTRSVLIRDRSGNHKYRIVAGEEGILVYNIVTGGAPVLIAVP